MTLTPPEDPRPFSLVLSPTPTPACSLITSHPSYPSKSILPPLGSRLELSPETFLIGQKIGQKLNASGGSGLIIDYGRLVLPLSIQNSTALGQENLKTGNSCSSDGDSFRGIRDHEVVDPFGLEPGTVDLSSDVDFTYLKHGLGDSGKKKGNKKLGSSCLYFSLFHQRSLTIFGSLSLFFLFYLLTIFQSIDFLVQALGPVSQTHFLGALHIQTQLNHLLKSLQDKEKNLSSSKKETSTLSKSLIDGYHRIMDPNGMGKAYKVLGIIPKTQSIHPVIHWKEEEA